MNSRDGKKKTLDITGAPHPVPAPLAAPQAAAPELLPCPWCSAPHPLAAFVPGAECACGERLLESCRGYRNEMDRWRDCPDSAAAELGYEQCGECRVREGMTVAQVWRRMERV